VGVTGIQLRDGAHLEIRPLTADDRGLLRAAFEGLSSESRYRRFLGPMPTLSERDLDYLTQIDHHDHEAVVAIDTATGDGVGVARFVRIDEHTAEPALAVVDAWQRRGVGTALLGALAQRAGEEGIERFCAPVLAANREAIRVLESLGEASRRRSGHELELTIELPVTGAAAGGWRVVLRQAALRMVEPARPLLARVWARRPGSPQDPRANVIVVGYDGSEPARAALHAAAQLAGIYGARVKVVGVQRRLRVETATLQDAVQEAAGRLGASGIDADAHLLRGDAALELADMAQECNARLLVVGAHRRPKRLLGSVSELVAFSAPCDVLLVRAPGTGKEDAAPGV